MGQMKPKRLNDIMEIFQSLKNFERYKIEAGKQNNLIIEIMSQSVSDQ